MVGASGFLSLAGPYGALQGLTELTYSTRAVFAQGATQPGNPENRYVRSGFMGTIKLAIRSDVSASDCAQSVTGRRPACTRQYITVWPY